MRTLVTGFTLGCLVSLAACGGGPEPTAPTGGGEEAEEPTRRGGGGPSPDVSAEIGALDEGEVTQTFKDAMPDLESCLDSGRNRVEFLGGNIGFKLKIDTGGRAVEAYLSQTDLGDRETEKCMVNALRKRTWPKPQGGKHGLASNSFAFEADPNVRPPEALDGAAVSEAVQTVMDDLQACKEGVAGSFQVTLYLSDESKVLGVGVLPPGPGADDASDCIVNVVKGATFKNPGSWAAKGAFEL